MKRYLTRKMKRLTDLSGFSMLEVMIAMIILTMALLVLLNMAMVALDGNDWSNKTTIATQLMQEKFEELRSYPDLNSAMNGSDTVNGTLREWNISQAANFLREVEINVRWESVRGDTQSDTMVAYVRTDSI